MHSAEALPRTVLTALAIALAIGAAPGQVTLAAPAEVSAQVAGGRAALQPIPEPDLSRAEKAVREALQQARAELSETQAKAAVGDSELSAAYGRLGKIYHAHHQYEPAVACYRNAEALAPDDFRWPYYLGHVLHQMGRLPESRDSLIRVLALQPDYTLAHLRLGEVYFELGEMDKAEGLLKKAAADPGLRAAALYNLGKISLARRDYHKAVERLRRALADQPEATVIHYPLAMAYRGLGDVEGAREQLDHQGNVMPQVPDPVVDELSSLLTGVRIHLDLANRSVSAEDYQVAAREFGAVLDLDPDNVYARVSLARCLYILGDAAGTELHLREALQRAPKDDKANFFMGLLAESQGRDADALQYYETSLAANPERASAHYYLANVLMRMGRYGDAAKHYGLVVAQEPQHLPARLMEALALTRTPGGYAQARARLEDAVKAYPDQLPFSQALARVLAASPDPAVRDGRRALDLAQSVDAQFHGVESLTTLAMAYAELGQFDKASSAVQDAVSLALWSGRFDLTGTLKADQERYQAERPCRTPWAPDDPLFSPVPAEFGGTPAATPAEGQGGGSAGGT